MVNPIAQKWEHRHRTSGLTRVTVDLNESQVERIDRRIAEDAGTGKRLTRAMIVSFCVSDSLGLNRPVPFTPITTEKGPR